LFSYTFRLWFLLPSSLPPSWQAPDPSLLLGPAGRRKSARSCHPDPAAAGEVSAFVSFHRIKQMLGYAASRVIQPLCHSEKRSDGESAFVVKTKEQADSSLSLGMTGRRTFTNIGGPKAHGTLGMKGTLFSSLPVHRGFSRLCCSLVPKSLMGWHLFKILDRVEALGIYFRRKTA
jgi:hypothetical protein